ncbi:MAG: hypothetical protein Q8R83_10095 [Legionellaceae bacterium]|nr:hypothetical protein [Legionellaceae bacterium]
MTKQSSDKNSNNAELASLEPSTFFARAFKKKYEAYCRGEKEAYVNGKVWYDSNNPGEGNYFQKWIIKNLPAEPIQTEPSISERPETVTEKPSSEKKTYASSFFSLKMPQISAVSGLIGSLSPKKSQTENLASTKEEKASLSRLFDEIELRPEILEQQDGLGEYELAQQNPAIRLQQVTQEVARLLLTDNLTELNDNTIAIVNEIQKNAYEKLLKRFEPDSPRLDEQEKVTIAKQKLANEFISAVLACYGQKLMDIADTKHPIVGWNINLLSLNNVSEIPKSLGNKLTLIKIKNDESLEETLPKTPPQYFIYGNTNGDNWQLTEINRSTKGIDTIPFEIQDTFALNRGNRYVYEEITATQAHTLSAREVVTNKENQKAYDDYFITTVSIINNSTNKLNTKEKLLTPISNRNKTKEQLLSAYYIKCQSLQAERQILIQYKQLSLEKADILKVNEAIEIIETHMQQINLINEFIQLDINLEDKIISFLDETQNSLIEDSIAKATVRLDIISENQKILANYNQYITSTDPKKAKRMRPMIQKESADLVNSEIDLTSNQSIDVSKHINSPIFLIAKRHHVQSVLANLNLNMDKIGIINSKAKILGEIIKKTSENLAFLEKQLQEGLEENKTDLEVVSDINRVFNEQIVKIAGSYSRHGICRALSTQLTELTYLPTAEQLLSDLNNLLKPTEYPLFHNLVTTMHNELIGCHVQLTLQEPTQTDIDEIKNGNKILIIKTNETYQIGLKGSGGQYVQEEITDNKLLALLDHYTASLNMPEDIISEKIEAAIHAFLSQNAYPYSMPNKRKFLTKIEFDQLTKSDIYKIAMEYQSQRDAAQSQSAPQRTADLGVILEKIAVFEKRLTLINKKQRIQHQLENLKLLIDQDSSPALEQIKTEIDIAESKLMQNLNETEINELLTYSIFMVAEEFDRPEGRTPAEGTLAKETLVQVVKQELLNSLTDPNRKRLPPISSIQTKSSAAVSQMASWGWDMTKGISASVMSNLSPSSKNRPEQADSEHSSKNESEPSVEQLEPSEEEKNNDEEKTTDPHQPS